MKLFSLFSLAVSTQAAILRFGDSSLATIENKPNGALHFGGSACVDRRNFCGDFEHTVNDQMPGCPQTFAPKADATIVAKNTFKSSKPGNPDAEIALFSDSEWCVPHSTSC